MVSPISLETARDGTDANVDIMDHAIRNIVLFRFGRGVSDAEDRTREAFLLLGIYLFCCAMYELVLVDRAALIDPLFGDFAVLVRYMRFSTNQASAIQWLAIAAHLIFAMSCLVKHPLLKTYVVTELLSPCRAYIGRPRP